MKKIISFSLWGDQPKYTTGALENIELQQKLFPGWLCRFYIHKDVSIELQQNILNEGGEVIIMNEDISNEPKYQTNGIHMGWFWRFNVIKDLNVERFIIRDIDSRLSQREKNCIIDWERSGKPFNIIRDNIMHAAPILAGTWGATKEFIDSINYTELLESFLIKNKSNNSRYGGYDQFFLSTEIYPLIKNNVCIHDDFNLFPDEKSKKIPHIRINNEFIGQPIEL